MEIGSNIKVTKRELDKLGISLSELIKDLSLPNPEYQNILRFGRGKFYRKVEPTICYLKEKDGVYEIPRYYSDKLTGFDKDLRIDGRKTSYECLITLRDYQKKYLAEHKEELSSEGYLIEAPCGGGKTILGIYQAHKVGRQALVVVPTYYLAKQWATRISETTTASVAILSSSDSKVMLDRDFTIVVTDLFTCRVLPEELVNNIGLVILDEAHRIGAETYLPILDEIPARWRIALTATFRRTDNVHKILAYHFGKVAKMPQVFPPPYVYAVRTNISGNSVCSSELITPTFQSYLDRVGVHYHTTEKVMAATMNESLNKTICNAITSDMGAGVITKTEGNKLLAVARKLKDCPYATLDSYLNEHSKRRKMVVRLIEEALKEGRTILFLSKRKEVLHTLAKYFHKYKPMVIVSETAKRTEEEDYYLQNECRLVLGVTQLAKEGLDIDRLDTLIIHLPMKDTEQAIGRIARLHPTKKQPKAFYLLDNFPITQAVFTNAKKYLKINGDFKGVLSLADALEEM